MLGTLKLQTIKTIRKMKKMMALLATLMIIMTACADRHQIVEFSVLPVEAQNFIKTHYKVSDVSFIKMENEGLFKEYNVYLHNATEIEFNHKGSLKSIDCKRAAVPKTILPKAIVEYVSYHYPQAIITEYNIGARRLEIGLNVDLELYFDLNGNFIGMDD